MIALRIFSLLFAFVSIQAHADVSMAPPSFQERGAKRVFVDILSAEHEVLFDLDAQSASVRSRVEFRLPRDGSPLFDLAAVPTAANLDGVPVMTSKSKSPDGKATYLSLEASAESGRHELVLEYPLAEVRFEGKEGLRFGAWMSDLTPVNYLGRYFVSNLDYDQHPMAMTLAFRGGDAFRPSIFTNGELSQTAAGAYRIEFPLEYNATMPYLHLFREGLRPSKSGEFRSVDGREIPLTVYADSEALLDTFLANTEKHLKELEANFGPWPHPGVLIYGTAGGGGMEYAGATVTSDWALSHELFHAYHARSLTPAGGNDGWMDEAIASWRDNGYRIKDTSKAKCVNQGMHGAYNRATPRTAYTDGEMFMRLLAHEFRAKGLDFKNFLADYHRAYRFKIVNNDLFLAELERALGKSLKNFFECFVYGKGAPAPQAGGHAAGPDYHRFTKEELERLL